MSDIKNQVESVTPAKNNTRTLKLIGGIVLAIIGIILTLQDPENVYCGFIWLGSDFFFVAAADFITNKKVEDKTMVFRDILYKKI